MNVNPRISFPPEVDFVLISSLIRETCKVAFAMQTLDPPLELAFACDGELYNDMKSVPCAGMFLRLHCRSLTCSVPLNASTSRCHPLHSDAHS